MEGWGGVAEAGGSLQEDESKEPAISGSLPPLQLDRHHLAVEACKSGPEHDQNLLPIEAQDVRHGTQTHMSRATEIREAVEAGDARSLLELLDATGADVNAHVLEGGQTLLQRAVVLGYEGVCELLLERGALQEPFEEDGASPFSVAAREGYANICRLLAARGATPRPDRNGNTPLHTAAWKGRFEICEFILNLWGDPNAKNADGATPLFFAAADGREDIATLLLDHGALHVRRNNGATPLSLAASSGHLGMCKLLISRGAKIVPTLEGDTPLHNAATGGHTEVCKFLLESGALHSQMEGGCTPLWVAAHRGHEETVRELLPTCKPFIEATTLEGISALWIAAQRGHLGICALLIEYGAKHICREEDQATPLLIAAYNGHLEICRLLLDNGASHVANTQGFTPLSAAVAEDHADVCRLLLDRGATHAPLSDGATPLLVAVQRGNSEIARLLLERGAAHSGDKFGNTPLIIAATKRNATLCDLLLRRGATHEPNHFGETPVLVAATDATLVHALISSAASAAGGDVAYPSLDPGPDPGGPGPAEVPPQIAARYDAAKPNVKAMISCRLPEVFAPVRTIVRMESVTDLIFWVHVAIPYRPRRFVLDLVYDQAEHIPPEVAEVIAVFSSQSRSSLKRRRLEAQTQLGIERGLQVREAWEVSKEPRRGGGRRRRGSSFGPRFPWGIWRHVLEVRYGVPEAWVGEKFWESPSASCKGWVPLLQQG